MTTETPLAERKPFSWLVSRLAVDLGVNPAELLKLPTASLNDLVDVWIETLEQKAEAYRQAASS